MDLPSYFGHQNGHMSGGGGGAVGSGGGGGLWRRPQPLQPHPYGNSNGSLPLPGDAYPPAADLLRDFPSTRPSNGFSEQQALMRVWYKSWSPAERLVSLTAMIEHLSDTQMTLLRNILQARLQHKPGLLMKEARANKPEVVYRECAVSPPEQALDFLQDHLPLLALTNHEAKPLYLNGVMRAVRAAMQPGAGSARLEQARQLLGLLAVHPVLTRDDKRVVHGLFGEFAEAASVADTVPAAAAVLASPDRRPGGHLLSDQRRHSACAAFGGEPRVPSPAFSPPQDPSGWQGRNLLSPADASEGGLTSEQQLQQQQRLRSNSLTPPGTFAPPGDISPGDLLVNKPRSSSIHLDHSPLGPGAVAAAAAGAAGMGLLTTVAPPLGGSARAAAPTATLPQAKKVGGGYTQRSASQCNLTDISRSKDFSVRGSGTTTLPKWLHKLRLHKYTWIFARMTYEELFDVTLEKLLSLGVTQGGANKLLRNIQELNERSQKLRDLEQGLAENKISLVSALEVMQVLVVSPMRAHKPRLIPSPAPAPPTTSAGTPLIRVTRSDESGDAGGGGSSGDDTDLQALITRVLAKMCTQLLVSQSADDEAIQSFLWVLDEATWHEAFTDAQRRKFVTWKRQISLELGRRQVFPPPFRRHSDARQYHSQRRHSDARGHLARRYPNSGAGRAAAAAAPPFSGYPAPSIGYWGGAPAASPPPPPPPPAAHTGPGRGGGRLGAALSPTPLGYNFPRRTSLQESVLELPPSSGGLYRTNSGDIYRPPAAAEAQRPGGASSDLYRTPASTDVYRPPVSTDVYRPPVSTEVYRPSASSDVYRPPTCTEVYRPPVSSDMYRAPGPSADLYRPSVSGPFSAPPPPPGYGAGRCLHTIPASSAAMPVSSGSGGAAAEPALRESSPGASQRDSLAATEIICHSVCETALE